MNSFLKWAGSKRRALPTLIKHVPKSFERYVEPFAGSGCLFFALCPKKALLSDINRDLIDTFAQIRNNVEGTSDELQSIPAGESEYYRLRAMDPLTMSAPTRAARFIYLNRFCFNGLYRTNRQGRFNVPFGGRNSGNLPTADHLRSCSLALRSASVEVGSFEATLSKTKSGDFVYLDPPYCIAARRIFNEYSNASFDERQLRLLRKALLELDQRGIPFLVSYGFSKEALFLARGFRQHHMFVTRQIAGFVSHRRKARELLVTNY